MVLETNGPSDFSVSLQSNPYRLVVEIRKARESGTGASSAVLRVAPMPGHAASEESWAKSRLREKDLPGNNLGATTTPQPVSLSAAAGRVGNKSEAQLRAQVPKFRLVLDAGHGGWDLGTMGRKGLMEKDLVLDIVDRLGKLLETRLGADVIYTRQDDTYLPLEKRTEIANLAQADMFVSVHANYSNDSSARGAETYYTNTYSSREGAHVGGRFRAERAENIDWNNVDIREKVQQSHRFAVSVQQALHRALAAQIPGMRNRGVKKASYVVLTGTSMPAILAEVSFVSSPADENILKSSSYRQNIAEGLYKGIAQYAATNHHVNLASASSQAQVAYNECRRYRQQPSFPESPPYFCSHFNSSRTLILPCQDSRPANVLRREKSTGTRNVQRMQGVIEQIVLQTPRPGCRPLPPPCGSAFLLYRSEISPLRCHSAAELPKAGRQDRWHRRESNRRSPSWRHFPPRPRR